MPVTLLIFDFGANEDAAQQARHRLEGWRQAFRLGGRMKFKFERQSAPSTESASPAPEPATERFRLLVRLEFSAHEKLTAQRWLDRLASEAPFQNTERQLFERGQEGFDGAEETFDSLP